MATKFLRRTAAATALLGATASASSDAWAQAPDVPVFTSEAALRDPAQAEAIEQFWTREGRPGRFVGKGGLTLAFVRFVQKDPSAEQGAIVVVSGRTESLLKYKELARDLWNAGYSVYIHDHRGQGLSQREPAVEDTPQKGHVERFSDYVDDLRQFIGTEVAAGQHKNRFLLAHSMGGAVAALLLESGGAEVTDLNAAVLSSPMLKIKGVAGLPADIVSCKIAKRLVAAGRAKEYVAQGGGYDPKPFDKNQYTHSEMRYARLLAQYEAVDAIRLGSPTHGWFAAACDAAFQARTQAASVRTPVLVMVAGEDAIVHPTGADEFCRNLPRSPSSDGCGGTGGGPVPQPGARHEMLIESDSVRTPVLQRALQFFASHRRP